MYSSIPYSIYISTEPIYTSLYTSCPYSYFSPHFFLCPFRAFFIFRAAYTPPPEKNFSEKNFSEKKFFLFLRKKFLLFGAFPEKKFFLFIFSVCRIFFPPYILLRSVKTITVGISYSRQNKLVRRENIYGAWGEGQKYLGRARNIRRTRELRRSELRSEHVVWTKWEAELVSIYLYR